MKSLYFMERLNITPILRGYFKLKLSENSKNSKIILPKKCPYSVQIPKNTDQKNSEYGHFSQC